MAYPEPLAEISHERRRGIHLTVIAVVIIATLLVGGFFYAFTRERILSPKELVDNGALIFESARELPAFNLVDDRGEPFTLEDLQGHWNLIFFGFTYCPDICPTTLAQLNQFYRSLPAPMQQDTQVIMATVDPARDTVEKLNGYITYFNPDFRGVTGEFLDVHRFATSLNIPFGKVPGGGDNYLVDHSANVVLINPQGHYVGFFKAPLDIEKMKVTYPSIRAIR